MLQVKSLVRVNSYGSRKHKAVYMIREEQAYTVLSHVWDLASMMIEVRQRRFHRQS
jgi:hypothetical protein